MKILSSIVLVSSLVLAGSVTGENLLGLSGSHPDTGWLWFEFETQCDVPFTAYIVLTDPTVTTVAGYELSISFSSEQAIVLEASGPNGWTNFGDVTNHLAGYGTPVPVTEPGTVLASLQILCPTNDFVEVYFHPASPPSMPGQIVIADGSNPDELIVCGTIGFDDLAGIFDCWVVPVESRTFHSIKALFRS